MVSVTCMADIAIALTNTFQYELQQCHRLCKVIERMVLAVENQGHHIILFIFDWKRQNKY